MIELMNYLDERFSLDLMLIVPEMASAKTRGYIDQLRLLAQSNPRIRFLPPVKSNEIVAFINKYDLGVFLLPPVNFNYANTLPNKVFDFVQARLGIAIGPTPEMKAIVDHFHNGVVSANFTAHALAFELNKLTPEMMVQFKLQSAKAATELSAEFNRSKLLELIAGILSA